MAEFVYSSSLVFWTPCLKQVVFEYLLQYQRLTFNRKMALTKIDPRIWSAVVYDEVVKVQYVDKFIF